MVRITRNKVQQQARRRGGAGSGMMHMARTKLLEKDSLVGALALLGIGLLLVVYVLCSSVPETSLRGSSFSDPNHPNLQFVDKNAEQYNAFALDIIQTLECHKLLNTTDTDKGMDMLNGEDMSNGDLPDDPVVRAEMQRRRRLDEGMPAPVDDVMNDVGGDEGAGKMEDVVDEKAESWAHPDGPDAGANGNGDNGDFGDNNEDLGSMTDDFGNFDNVDGGWKNPTAKHLFCMAAFASNDQRETAQWKDSIKCDATHTAQKSLLELWSMARGEMTPELLLKVLGSAVESSRMIAQKELHLWSPREDTGLGYMLAHVNEESKTVDQGGLYGLDKNLGPGKTFIDVGSCLGTTSMAIALLYPGSRIVSIEVASPNWLMQEINFRCNANHFADKPTILLAGVGPDHAATTFARYTWKPDQVTTARSWTPASEINSNDEVLSVKLRPWHSILAESEILHDQVTNQAQAHIDVLNVDCGACEYNLIPSMTDAEFDSITTVMGGVHWGYIPKQKLPSSRRGKETHERLCKHENFARTAKECCQFPSMEVISSYPGQVLYQEDQGKPEKSVGKAGTVSDVAGDLCNDFDAWATEKHVYTVDSDWGWFQLTASAQGE
eukprot:CAMPEP_0198138600 /NCGR_PEP_ID=MMETSP1443-20131203/1980_1 /TAXON_ID=186043 /ORGANISM="Entomoneis sp., Strain CCMP2396" /LENGTH=607 /DNA_ID=CAMNT_0043800431 /DNA_START=119 /DNA_END=1942 /DNA_ORIENTATION=-